MSNTSTSFGVSYEALASITHACKEGIDAVQGLYMCDNTTFTSFASLVSLTTALDSNVLVATNRELSAENSTETDSDFDFFGFGSNFRSRVQSEVPMAHNAAPESIVDPLAAAINLGNSSSLVLDAASSRSADSDDDGDPVAGSVGPAPSDNAPDFPPPPAAQTMRLYSAAVCASTTALYTSYTTPHLVSLSKDTPTGALSVAIAMPLTRLGDTAPPTQTNPALEVDHHRKMDASFAFEKWRHACLALAASPSTIAVSNLSSKSETDAPRAQDNINSENDTRIASSDLPLDIAASITNSASSTQIEPVSRPGTLCVSKHLQLLAAISSVSTASLASMSSMSIHSIQIRLQGEAISAEHIDAFAPTHFMSSCDEEYMVKDGYDSLPSFAAVMSAFVSSTSTLPPMDAFSSIPSSHLISSSLSVGDLAMSLLAISSLTELSYLRSTETEHAGLVRLPTLLSAPSEDVVEIPSMVNKHLPPLPASAEIERSRKPLMLSFPSIQLAKRRLGTIQEALPTDRPELDSSCPLSISRSMVSSVSSESAVLVTNPPRTSPYSPHSCTFESLIPHDISNGGCQIEAELPSSMSMEYRHDSALEESLFPPLPALAVSAFPCPLSPKSRSSLKFPCVPNFVTCVFSRRPSVSNKDPTARRSASPISASRVQQAMRRIKQVF